MAYPTTDLNPEHDSILIPVSGGYQQKTLLNLFGLSARDLRSWEGFGLAPLHFITQRGPFQDGESVIDMRYDARVIQILIARQVISREKLYELQNELIDLLRPSRSFGSGAVNPLKYRKLLPGGRLLRGSDLQATNGTKFVTSDTAAFVHNGGLEGGERITISGVDYVIDTVLNDYSLNITANFAGATGNHAWQYRKKQSQRDLLCLLESGPRFDGGPNAAPFFPPGGYAESLRFVAHNPFWIGSEQSESWATIENIDDLVFDGTGGFFGIPPGSGRWIFAPSAVGDTVNVIYYGTQRARPVITITGPALNPVVTNITTGRSITVVANVPLGSTLTIDTGALTVSLQDGTNFLPFTTGDLATFGLEPPPLAPARVNQVKIDFTNATSKSTAVLTWENLYAGI